MIRPKPLKKGDTIGLIGTSSPAPSERMKPAIEAMEKLGLKVVVGESCYTTHGYLSGKDELRGRDLNRMFQDPSIDGVFCIRGGYGSPRILDLLDYDMIKKNPKAFTGYSDVTALHIAFNQRCDLITFHSPMPSTEFYKGVDDYTMDYYIKNIFSDEPLGLLKNPKGLEMKTLVGGNCEGQLIGGNLSLVAASVGTKYEIDTKEKVLFLEDVDEEPYRVDRMILQLKLSGKLDDAVGIILGAWTNCNPKEPEKSLSLMEVFEELIISLNKPIIYDFACGHCLPTMTLPLGAKVKLDATNKQVYILE